MIKLSISISIDEDIRNIGYITFTNPLDDKKDEDYNKIFIQYLYVDEKYRGKGYGKIAYKMFIPYLFKHYDLHKITLEVLSTNIVAKNLYEKLGFIYEGKKREEIYKKGKWIDSIIMSILRSEYNQS
jgi:RimJ/RimL family protein N-acetyltransferase